jgi:hypothetical protein
VRLTVQLLLFLLKVSIMVTDRIMSPSWSLQNERVFLHANELTIDGWLPLGGFRMGTGYTEDQSGQDWTVETFSSIPTSGKKEDAMG